MKKRWWLTPCGLDCSTCTIHLRTDEELEYWRRRNIDIEKIRCDGCRSDRKGHHWSPDCKILQCCVYDHNYYSCTECPDFPCSHLEEWGKESEYHARGLKLLKDMKATGVEQWLVENGFTG